MIDNLDVDIDMKKGEMMDSFLPDIRCKSELSTNNIQQKKVSIEV